MEEDIEFRKLDIKGSVDKIKGFFSDPKYLKYSTILIIIVLMLLGTWIRIQPAFLPATDSFAKNTIDNSIRSQLDAQISQQYPNLDPNLRQAEVNKQFIQVKKSQKDVLKEQERSLSEQFKEQFRADKSISPLINKGDYYLPDIDTYFYLKAAYNIETKGQFYDELRNGIPYDNHMNAPNGVATAKNIHNNVIAFVKKISGASLVKSQYFVPVIIGVLGIIPAFFLGRKISGNNVGGIVTAFFYMAHPFALGRSAAGLADTDIYQIFFPITIAWLFIETINSNILNKILKWGSLTGLAIGIYSIFWGGWWFIFDIILASLITYIAIVFAIHFHKTKIKKTQEKIFDERLKNALISLGVIFSSSFLITSIANLSFRSFFEFIRSALGSRGIQASLGEGIWPNVYTTVAELNIPSFGTVINSLSGELLFILSLIGIILLIFNKRENKYQYRDAIFLIVWYIVTLYATTKGIRFVLLIVPAFTIAMGASVGILYEILTNLMRKINVKELIAKPIFILLIVLLLIPYYNSAMAVTTNSVPMMNDGWWNSLVKIREETAPNAIITSWWDFGHWFKVIADRPVTFDGASQGGRPAHTVGKILMTNEDEAIGLLRMYDCGHDSAYLFLKNKTGNVEKTVEIINKITQMNKSSASDYLKKQGFSDDEIEKLLKLTHCNPPEGIFITSEDMVGKSGVWSHFGSWNFTKSRLWNEFKNRSKVDFIKFTENYLNISNVQASQTYDQLANFNEGQANNWIGPFSGYLGSVGCTKSEDNSTNTSIINCNGLLIDAKTKNLINESTIQSQGIPQIYSIVYADVENAQLKERILNEKAEVSMAILPDENTAIFMDKKLATGVFTRLFYYDGLGSKYFEKLSDVRDVTGARIVVWGVEWD